MDIIGNWKMYGTPASVAEFNASFEGYTAPQNVSRIGLCVPYTLLHAQHPFLKGAQHCHDQASGAHTGDISASMVKDAGCDMVIIGHSERRQNHEESSEQAKNSAHLAIEAGLNVVLCVGESLGVREAGDAEAFVSAQLDDSLPQNATPQNTVIAYEPIWAIGTGRVAGLKDIASMHNVLHKKAGFSVLYGGSVKPENAKDILALDDVHGVLVGGASLDADSFKAIIDAA